MHTREIRNLRRLVTRLFETQPRHIWVSNLLKGLLATLGVILTCKQIQIDSKQSAILESQAYYELARSRPRLKPVALSSDSVVIEFLVTPPNADSKTQVRLLWMGTARFVNRGDSPAVFRLSLFGIERDAELVFRKWVLSGTLPWERVRPDSLNTIEWAAEHIEPDSALTRTVAIPYIRTRSDSIAYFHQFVLYENEFGVLFDSYSIVKVRFPLVVGSYATHTDSSGVKSELWKWATRDLERAVDSLSGNVTARIYSPEERQQVYDLIETLGKRYSH